MRRSEVGSGMPCTCQEAPSADIESKTSSPQSTLLSSDHHSAVYLLAALPSLLRNTFSAAVQSCSLRFILSVPSRAAADLYVSQFSPGRQETNLPKESTGRGGVGTIRASSASRDGRPIDGPDDFSITRGREPLPASVTGAVCATSITI